MPPLPRLAVFVLLPLILTSCDSNTPEQFVLDIGTPREVAEADYTTTSSGLKYFDFTVGDGAEAQSGDRVSVHYSGWLTDGTPFDSSKPRGQPIFFNLGSGAVIPGFDEGITGMHIGGDRQLILPPELAYGAFPPSGIPPNATLIFEVELVDIVNAAGTP